MHRNIDSVLNAVAESGRLSLQYPRDYLHVRTSRLGACLMCGLGACLMCRLGFVCVGVRRVCQQFGPVPCSGRQSPFAFFCAQPNEVAAEEHCACRQRQERRAHH
eukprot:Gregarina_sp_Pseudo_9__929@NODE_1595_length_1470_cov_6_821104_g1479_i0_p4_GENE_NODE_1595_length_1470_cov_6_821104_g1479_i0NODE_1595_length_1470_cov_6_821104_g1479_i0_p4_ORF_typecomplete_len105_score0_85DHODB_FeS_bind/PF10418_9/1DHODB_FeS_bind/PF10418_9/8_8e02_NODE_1595_length_1470_cov_6_821104_g1479_i063377